MLRLNFCHRFDCLDAKIQSMCASKTKTVSENKAKRTKLSFFF